MGGDVQRMRIYQTVEPVPSRVLGLLRLLHHSEEHGLPRSTIIDLLQPKSLRTKESADNLATNTIAAVIELSTVDVRLVEEKEDDKGQLKLSLDTELFGCADQLFDDRVRFLLERAALRPEVKDSPNGFATVCAWLLWQSPANMPQGHAELKKRMQSDGLNYEELGLNNDARWDMVVYWATYFGLLWQWQDEKCKGLVSDPSMYLMRHLDELLPSKSQVSIREFIATLSHICPVLDGGTMHETVANELTKKGVLPANHRERLSPALSFALRNLKEQAILRYWCPDDQRIFHLMSFDEKVAFIAREGESS